MFGIGIFEIFIIILAVLVLFGPNKLPEVAQQLGRFFVQFRRMTGDVRSSIDDALKKAEHDLLLEEKAKIQALLKQQDTQKDIQPLEKSDEDRSYQPENAEAAEAVYENKELAPWEDPAEETLNPEAKPT